MTMSSQGVEAMFHMPEVLRVSNLKMSPSDILTKLLPTTQLQNMLLNHNIFLAVNKVNNNGEYCCVCAPDIASEDQYKHNICPLNVKKASGLWTSSKHSPSNKRMNEA